MEIAIIGPGSVGTLPGGLLSVSGHQVRLRGKKRPARQGTTLRLVLPDRWLMAEGVRFEGPEDPTGSLEAFLVTMGRHHLHVERRPDFARLIGGGDAPVAFFNCDPAEPQRLAVPGERLRFGLTLMNAVKLQDGEVELTTPKSAIIYEKSRPVSRLLQGFASFGFQLLPVEDALPYMSSFLIYQLLFLPVAMCNTTLDCFLSMPEGRELALALMGEGFLAMEKAGLPLATLPLMDPRELAARIEKKPQSFEQAPSVPGRGFNSILQSYLRGRPTEAGQLNRKAVEIASAAGLHLTWNWRILQKASRVASLGFYSGPAELLKALA